MQGDEDKETARHGLRRSDLASSHLPVALLAALIVGCVAIGGTWISDTALRVAPALIWALAFGALGVLLGFLFAIPRVGPAPAASASASPGGSGNQEQPSSGPTSESDKPRDYPFNEVNSNLVEVSDWLTKIIVGVGLVELKEIPGAASNLANFIAPSLGVSTTWGAPLAGAIMLYFTVLGFIAGYLLTRVYLALMFKRAETLIYQEQQFVRLESGKRISVVDLSRLQQTAIEDVQRQVAGLAQSAGTQLTEEAPVIQSIAARRVLWVDDNPENNTLLVDQLTRWGILVDQVTSTDAAISILPKNKYDLVLSDMSRKENGIDVDDAGVQLVTKVHQVNPQLQVLIFCSSYMASKLGSIAKSAGAALVTSSGTKLLAEIRKTLMIG